VSSRIELVALQISLYKTIL